MRSTPLLMAAALLSAVPTLAQSTSTKMGVELPSSPAEVNSITVQGCFSSPGELTSLGVLSFNSESKCGTATCLAKGYAVAATTAGSECYCGNEYPPLAALVNDTNCDTPCTGYGQNACGGSFFWTVYNTGLTAAVKNSPDSILSSSASSSPTSTTTNAPATVLVPVTLSPSASNSTSQATAKSSKGGGSTNTAGIAAGVVVGVVVVAGLAGGAFFYMRRRSNKELEEKHRRNAAISTFFPGKPPSSSGGYSVADSRLDPVMAQRRVSNGSIADNEDYSRRILRVTNA